MDKSVYLKDIPLNEAMQRLYSVLEKTESLKPLAAENVPLEETAGRITAQPIWAKMSSPHYRAAAVDGIAVNAEDSYGASKINPKILKIGSQAHWINTGGLLPDNCNAMIMVENVQSLNQGEVEIREAASPWQHVRPLGEDIVATELVLTENHFIRPQDIGAMATAGITEVPVRIRPVVTIIPTGSELVRLGIVAAPGKIIEFNSIMLAKLVEEWGATVYRHPIVPDDVDKIKDAATESLQKSHIVIIGAGSSAGSKDFTARVVSEIGELLVHGIAIRPGHPCVLGVSQGKPLIGIPGYPVSSLITTELIIKPLVYRLLGSTPPATLSAKATITRKIFSPLGQEEFVRVTLGKVKNRIVAAPLPRGAGITMSLVRADGIIRVPRFSEGLKEDIETDVELRRPLEEIENTILAIGSHDLALDILANLLHKYFPNRRLSSAHVGSLGGLMAIKRGEAHLAGSQLLDEETGEYNISSIKQVLGDRKIILMTLGYRMQGLMVSKGNPKNINTLSDLLRQDVVFINRQRGSGTRVLLDYKLKQGGLDPSHIKGYEREEYTHTGVAATVGSGAADVGIGIMAAAKALDLDFVPLLKEKYELVIPRDFYESDLLQPLLDIIRSQEFKDIVTSLGGYDAAETGSVIEIL